MPMMRKSIYEKKRAHLVQRLSDITTMLAEAERTNGASLGLALLAWNELHDAAWMVEQDIQRLDDYWARRHWTAQDYAQHTLIVNNID